MKFTLSKSFGILCALSFLIGVGATYYLNFFQSDETKIKSASNIKPSPRSNTNIDISGNPPKQASQDELGLPNMGDNHEGALGFMNDKGLKWGALRGLTKDKNGKSKVSAELKKILKNKITLKGYMLPTDFSKKKITEFLLLPYIPSCMHIPPPPSNQIIYVKLPKGKTTKITYFPVEVTGMVKVVYNEELDSGFEMNSNKVKELEPQ